MVWWCCEPYSKWKVGVRARGLDVRCDAEVRKLGKDHLKRVEKMWAKQLGKQISKTI